MISLGSKINKIWGEAKTLAGATDEGVEVFPREQATVIIVSLCLSASVFVNCSYLGTLPIKDEKNTTFVEGLF